MRRDPNHQYNPMKISQLASLDPDTPWFEYISTILGPEHAIVTQDDTVVLNYPPYLSQLRLTFTFTFFKNIFKINKILFTTIQLLNMYISNNGLGISKCLRM